MADTLPPVPASIWFAMTARIQAMDDVELSLYALQCGLPGQLDDMTTQDGIALLSLLETELERRLNR